MELRHLRSFVVLAEERHFGRAAARLHIAQPALSQQLQQLEREVGVRLVDRSTRRVELTEAGRLLEGRAHEVLGSVARAVDELALLAAGRLGRVTVGLVGTATYDVLPRLAHEARRHLPEVELDLRGEVLAPRLLADVQSGVLDLAVLRPGPGAAAPDLVVETLRREPLVALLPAAHPRAGQAEVALADLADEPFVVHPSGARSTMHARVLEACARAGFRPRELREVAETATLAVVVAAGDGVALVPASVQALRLDGVVPLPLAPGPEGPECVDLALARRPDASPATLQVARLLRELLDA